VQRTALLVGELELVAGPGAPGLLTFRVLLAPVMADVGADRRAQGRPDPLALRQADQTTPPDCLAERGVSASGGDSLVEVIDVVEDGRDIRDLKSLQRDVPDARAELDADPGDGERHGALPDVIAAALSAM
jgi:hypothetical protein